MHDVQRALRLARQLDRAMDRIQLRIDRARIQIVADGSLALVLRAFREFARGDLALRMNRHQLAQLRRALHAFA